jgi:DNA modification methylase
MTSQDSLQVLVGDCRTMLREMSAQSVQCCVTSPPYFGLRDYGVDGQIGLEPSPAEYIEQIVSVFREVRRVLKDDGTLWLNLGDSYANDGKWGGHTGGKHAKALHDSPIGRNKRYTGLKPKDLIGIPWEVAFALRTDGWFLRRDIIWHKPNVMPESVTDRPTTAHEYLFLLSKSARYYYDADAIKEPAGGWHHSTPGRSNGPGQDRRSKKVRESIARGGFAGKTNALPGREAFRAVTETRNKRSVWTVPTVPYAAAHFATYPPALITPCILAGSRAGDVVLDPFGGSGTTGAVALSLGRKAILIELNPGYEPLIEERISRTKRPSAFDVGCSMLDVRRSL